MLFFIFWQILFIFDDFFQSFEKSLNMAKIWQNMKKILVRLAFNPFFCRFQVHSEIKFQVPNTYPFRQQYTYFVIELFFHFQTTMRRAQALSRFMKEKRYILSILVVSWASHIGNICRNGFDLTQKLISTGPIFLRYNKYQVVGYEKIPTTSIFIYYIHTQTCTVQKFWLLTSFINI